MTDDTYARSHQRVRRRDHAVAAECAVQTDGVGLRVGAKAEFTLIAPVKPGGAAIFKQRAIKAQIEAGYWEGKLGTVHDLRDLPDQQRDGRSCSPPPIATSSSPMWST